MPALLALIKGLLNNFFRDRQTFFFSLILPLIFLAIFGFMYANEGGDSAPIKLAAFIDGQDELVQILEATEEVETIFVTDGEAVHEMVAILKAHFGLIGREGELAFYYNPTRIELNSYYRQLGGSIAAKLDQQRSGLGNFLALEKEMVATEVTYSPLEYMLPGIIAISVVSAGLFAITATFLHFKEAGVLKRMIATPMKKVDFFMALILTRMVASFIGAAIILICSYLFFRLRFNINWPVFIPFLFISTLVMMALGVLITLVFKRAENASQFSGVLITIMIFFSGVYLPLELLPAYLRQVASLLPLTHVVKGLRHAMNVESMAGTSFALMSFVMLVLSIVLVGFVAGRGRWEEQ